jgi:membrane protein
MGIFSTKRSNYQEWLWQKNKKSEHHIFRLLRPFLQILNAVIEDIKEGQLRLRAMSLVYTTVISLVPLFAISFSVLKGLGAHNKIKPMILGMLEPLGEKRFEIADKLLGFIDNIQVGILGALGVVILVYTVIGMMQKIEHAFNYVWHVSSHRSFGQRFSDYLSVLL